MSGTLIVVEGIDGSGKSTQISLLAQRFVADLKKVLITRWNSSPIVHKALAKSKKQMALTPRTYSLLHCTDFCDRYDREIVPALGNGSIVMCDRYVYTALARDPVRGLPDDWLQALYGWAQAPDLTIYVDTPPETAYQRILQVHRQPLPYEAGMDLRISTDLHTSFLMYQSACRQNYLDMAKRYKFLVIDGSQDEDVQARQIWAAVSKLKGLS